MALFTSIDVIPNEFYLELKGDFEGILIKDTFDHYSALSEYLGSQDYPPNFGKLLTHVKYYLTFPYIQYHPDNPYSFEEEFITRVGSIYNLFDIYSEGKKYTFSYISNQIEELINLISNEKLHVDLLTIDNFTAMLVRKTEKVFLRPIYAEGMKAPEAKENIIPIYYLDQNYSTDNLPIIFDEPLEIIKEDVNKFLVLHELGIIKTLDSNR